MHINIAGRKVGSGEAPYVIAELSANHNGEIKNAFKLIKEAKKSGADAVKIQTFTPDTITLNCSDDSFIIDGGLWHGRTLYELYQEAHMPWEWHKSLFEYAKSIEITLFSSPFDFTAVDLLEDLNVPAYKIASFEIVDIPLIEYVASTGKPMIISTGLATKDEIRDAVEAARNSGCKDIIVLHCVSGYPVPVDQYNIRTIVDISKRFGVISGLSDHTLSNATAIASVSMGASVIEKHFTLNRLGGGPDDSFSMEPADLSALCSDVRDAWLSLGNVNYRRVEAEEKNLKFRRSIYVTQDIKRGELITTKNIRSVRPGYGISPKYWHRVIGRKVVEDIRAFSPLNFDVLE